MSLLKSPPVTHLWRSTVTAIEVGGSLPTRRTTLASCSLRPCCIRHNSGGGSTYFQNDSQRSRNFLGSQGSGSPSGPIYVLPSENPRMSNRVAGYFALGLVSGAIFAAALIYSPSIRVRVRDKDTERQASTFAKLASSEPDDADKEAARYAEDDGTEVPRNPHTTGEDLPPAELLALEKDVVLQKLWNLRETTQKDEKFNEVMDLLSSANSAQLKVHKVLLDLVTNPRYETAILDKALLESRPIILPDRSTVSPANASLIRVVDEQGKNKILILGIDLDWHESNRSSSSRFPADAYELDTWLLDLADDLERQGANAHDLAIYLYSNRVILDINLVTGTRWMTRYRQSDFPAGFPLLQMRQIKKVAEPSSNLNNIAAKAEASDKDREAS